MLHTLFSTLDHALAFIPALARLLLWGAATGAVTLFLYGKLSPQRRIAAAQRAATGARRSLSRYDGTDLRIVGRLAGRSFWFGLRHLGLVTGPSLLAALPLIALTIWMHDAYTHRQPAPGSAINVTIVPNGQSTTPQPALHVHWRPASSVIEQQDHVFRIRWPDTDSAPLSLHEASTERSLVTLPLSAARPVIRQHQPWHYLYANPAGYLPTDAPVNVVRFDLPTRRILTIGPLWLATWHAPYFLAALIAALVVKVRLGIH